ncbi:MAG: hypothetical protein IJT41_05105 [Clostridia bacterium]|nr:hypothetical protein [Clostridia bacterium]
MFNLNEIIQKRNVEFILTEVSFLANDYRNYPANASLSGLDEVRLKALTNTEAVVSVSRKIESPNHDFLSFYTAYDVVFHFTESIPDVETISQKDFLDELITTQKRTLENCLAKISLSISLLSAQVADGIPIVTPPNFIDS